MYRVMIVDDEMLVRLGLKSMVDWEALGFEIVGEAGNGQAAYEKFLVLRPELVITDIKMPKKDGLWLTEKIKAEYPDTEIIILTCHDEFDYARKALKLQVSDYILKAEMEEEDIRSIMKKKKDILDTRSEGPSKESQKEQEEGASFLGMLLNLKYPVEDIYQMLKKLQVSYEGKSCCFLLFDFSAELINERFTHQQISNIISVCAQLIENKMGEYQKKCFLKQLGKSIVVFLMDEHTWEIKLQRITEQIRETVLQYFNMELKIAVTPFAPDIPSVRGYVEWLFRAANYMFYIEPGETLTLENYDGKQERDISLDRELYQKITAYLLEGQLEAACAKVDELMGQMKSAEKNPFDFKLCMTRLIEDINRELKEYNMPQAPGNEFQQRILRGDDWGQTGGMMREYLELAASQILQEKVENSDILIRKARAYIEEHYQDKITLHEIAKEIGISRYYFSTLFKQETGTNFSTYLNEVRIKKAKEMLRNKEVTVSQIYDRVGFNDQQYFSKTFKKYTGMTVTEYREQF